jgi:hypothetical protein
VPRSLLAVTLALVALVIVSQIRIVAGGQTWDDVHYHADVAPPRLAASSAMLHGHAPAWWDGAGLGVPLAGEASHGALYPIAWLAASPRGLDWIVVVHLLWAALGVALWARRKASEPGALVAALLVATSGLLASCGTRGALFGLAHLPWIGVCASMLGEAVADLAPEALAAARRRRFRAAGGLALLVGLVALAGDAGALIDAVILAIALGARRPSARFLVAGLAGGVAIGMLQLLPALLDGDTAGLAKIQALPVARLLELLVPGAFGASDAARAVSPVAGLAPWGTSIFVGAPLLALAAVGDSTIRARIAMIAFAVFAGVAGHVPAVFGAPEVHLAALVLVLAPHAAVGLDALAAGKRRAIWALAAGAAATVLALGAFAALRAQHADLAAPIDRSLAHGALAVACMLAALALARFRSGKALPIVCALLAAPGFGSQGVIAPCADRAAISDPPAWVLAADGIAAPVRAFRPVFIDTDLGATGQALAGRDPNHRALVSAADGVATLAGTSAARFGIDSARTDDPGRPAATDRVWLAAAAEGGALLDRYGVQLSILPSTLVSARHFHMLGERGSWSLATLPVAPVAAVMNDARYAIDPTNALNLMFAPGGGTGMPRNTIVIRGANTDVPADGGAQVLDLRTPSLAASGPPIPCAIDRWDPGDIAVSCTAKLAGFGAISSSAAPGWRVTVDGADATPLVADVIRRAVALPVGTHQIHWTFTAPGLFVGALLALAGLLAALALLARSRLSS